MFPLHLLNVKFRMRVGRMSQERYNRKVCSMLVNMDSTSKETWATWIRNVLRSRGFSNDRLHQGTGDTGRLISDLKAKLTEISAQNWQANLHSSDRYDV